MEESKASALHPAWAKSIPYRADFLPVPPEKRQMIPVIQDGTSLIQLRAFSNLRYDNDDHKKQEHK